MNAEIFAEWLKAQGHVIYRGARSFWYDQGPRVVQAFPYHWLVEPTQAELDEFLKTDRLVGLRYSTPLAAAEGAISYHAVFEGERYELEDLGKWARKNVRRGLKNCTVEPITFARLAQDGWRLQLDTLDRQGRDLHIGQDLWQKRCLAAGDLPGFEAWGALVDGELAASVITFQMEDCAYMLYQQCERRYLNEHVNNALGFVVTQELVRRPQIHSILYGLHSLDAPPSVDEFKFRMGYTAKAVRQRVVFHPWLRPAFNGLLHRSLVSLRRRMPGNPTLAKTEGMLRFYRQGRLPLDQQDMPPPLREVWSDADGETAQPNMQGGVTERDEAG